MKAIQYLAGALAALFLVSCFGKEEKVAEAAPVPDSSAKPKPTRVSKPARPNRPPPPPQPQDGSMIVKPGGTATPKIPNVSKEDTASAVSSAEKELRKRKASTDADDPISKALKNVSDEDLSSGINKAKDLLKSYQSGQ